LGLSHEYEVSGFGVRRLGFGVWGAAFEVRISGFKILGIRMSRVYGIELRVWVLRSRV
jgi:hypothetical protein